MTSRSLTFLATLAVLCASFSVITPTAQSGAGAQASTPQRITEGFGEGAYRLQAGIVEPIVLRGVRPKYTAEAARARIEGEVVLEAVVNATGTVGAVRVMKSLDAKFGLDQEAINAAKGWLFRPAMFNGKPVPCVVQIVLAFQDSASGDTSGYVGGQQPFRTPQPSPPPRPTLTWMPDAEFLKGVARLGQPNVTMPLLVKSVEPKYTSDAMRAKLAGTVTVDMVVGPDGKVIRARIARSLDPSLGLDHSAIEAASQWTFNPGLVNGQPGAVLVTVTMEFRLH